LDLLHRKLKPKEKIHLEDQESLSLIYKKECQS